MSAIVSISISITSIKTVQSQGQGIPPLFLRSGEFITMGYLYIFGCIFFTVYGQLILKWRLSLKGAMPEAFAEKLMFLAKAFLDPFILSGFAAAFVASLFWMAAMTKFQVSFAYPFMSIAFIAVLFLSALFFHEPITLGKVLGLILITSGIIVTVKL